MIAAKAYTYAKQLKKLIENLTVDEVADRLGKSKAWLKDRLVLADLKPDIGRILDLEQMPLTNALALAQLSPENQEALLTQALTLSPTEFVPLANKVRHESRNRPVG